MAVTTEMSLHDLVDLSLGTPEVVNYRGLRTLLLAIVDTLKLGEVKAEIKESEKKEILAEKKEQLASQDGKSSSRPVSRTGLRSSTELLELEKKVSIIETKLDTLNQLPSNEDLMERVRSAGSSVIKPSSSTSQAPVSEMWQLIQVQKKAQSNEEGVSKLMSMVEHLMGEFQELKGDTERMRQQMDTINNKTAELHKQIDSINNSNSSLVEKLGELESLSQDQEKMNELQSNMEGLMRVLSSLPPVESIVTWPSMDDALKGIHQEPREVSNHWIQTSPMTGLSPIQPVVPTAHSAAQTLTPSPQHDQGQPSRPPSEAHPSTDIQGALKNIGELSGKHTQLEERVDSLEAQLSKKADLDEVERMLAEKGIPDDLSNMISEMKEGLDHFKESKEKDSDLLTGITSKIADLQGEADKLNQTCIHMLDEHSAKQTHIDALYDVVEKLQANKADKEDVTMEIDVKADKRALDSKISRNQFEGAVEEISRNLSNVMDQLSGHQSAWQQAVGEIKTDVDSKLDRLELDPLKAYLDKKIKAVNAKLVRKEPEMPEDAAGFRKQLIQKFHCISCDRPLDMTPQAPLASLPENKGLPGSRSGRPYTTFELEQIRTAQKSNQCHDVPDYFVTSRSCGGSHTLTYPHRRVARVTHLQHMPQSEEIPTPIANGKIETDVVGQDGHIYKARVSPAQMDHLPSLGKPKVQSARARSRLGSARVRSQTAPSMSDGLQSPRPSSSRQPSRPQSSRPMRPQSGRHSRSPPLTTPSTADGHPPTPSLSGSHGDQVSLNGSTLIHPSTVGEIAVELPGSGAPDPTEVPT